MKILFGLALLLVGCSSWNSQPLLSARVQANKDSDNLKRRQFLRFLALQPAVSISLVHGQPVFASNLPVDTGADTSKVGTVEALIPIVSLRRTLSQLESSQLVDLEKINKDRASIPSKEKEVKRIFDAYSDQVSYKQKFLDQNAFLVYYTKGFDGPGRTNIEEDVNQRQTMQFGARNEAWVEWENFLVELKFFGDPYNDLKKYLSDTIRAVDTYISLAPASDTKEAQRALGVSLQ